MAWDNFHNNTTEPQCWVYLEEKNDTTGDWEPADGYFTSAAGEMSLSLAQAANGVDQCAVYQLGSNTSNYGTYTLTFDGVETGPIPWYADSSQVQAALDAVLGQGAVVVADQSYDPIEIVCIDLLEHTFTIDITGLLIVSIDADLRIAISADNQHAATVYSAADSEIEVATVGQYTAPSAGCVRIAPVDSVNHPGVALLQFASSAFSGSNTLMSATGKANLITVRDSGETASYRATPLAVMIATQTAVSDKTGFSLTSAYDPAKTAAQAATALNSGYWTPARAAKLDNLDTTVSSRHASGAAVAKSPATLDWNADVTNKPTIGTSTLTQEQAQAAATAALNAYDPPTSAELVSAASAIVVSIEREAGLLYGIREDTDSLLGDIEGLKGTGWSDETLVSIGSLVTLIYSFVNTGQITVNSSVNITGDEIDLVRGDAISLVFTDSDDTWPENISSAHFSMRNKDDELELNAIHCVMGTSGGHKTVTVPIVEDSWEGGGTEGYKDHPFDIEFRLTTGEPTTRIRGVATVRMDVTRDTVGT